MKFLILLALLLTACAPILSVTRSQPHITYRIVQPDELPPGTEGQARLTLTGCEVSILQGKANVMVIAHEVGHCLDGGRSEKFGNAGCLLRHYACQSAEGFADTYALLYRSLCGNRLDVLGWPGSAPTTDQLPDPDQVTPALLPKLLETLAAQSRPRP